MTAPSYVSDLTEIADFEPSDTTTEPTGATLGTLAQDDTDNFIQGAQCSSKSTGASGAPALAGIGILDAGAHTITSPNAFYCWVFVGGGGLVDTFANGGIRLIIGNTSANYRSWRVDGSDFFPYIGWQCIAIETDNAVVPADAGDQVGSPSATKQYFGAVFNCKINIGKGNPMAIDALRWGRVITVTFGETANYATFAGIAAVNDANANRWGQFQAVAGGYQLQGKLLLGVTGGNPVDFRDSNVSIVTAVSRKVAASFNAIEIQHASSRVDWDAISWAALGTVSRGTFAVTDDCDVNLTGCSFTGLSTFSLKAGTSVRDCVFRQCDTVTAPGSDLRGSQMLAPRVAANTGAVIWNVNQDPNGYLDNMAFSKGVNAHHAIAFGTLAPTTMDLVGISFTGFSTDDPDLGPSTDNDTVLLFPDKGSNTNWTINAIGTSGVLSYKQARAGDTVTIVQNPVTLGVNVTDLATGDPVDARVYVFAAAGGDLTPGTVLINGTTTSGRITVSRTYTADQPIDGWVRKASGAPYYKEGPVGGVVDSGAGLEVTVQLVLDE
jgi:hypothetical protein